MSYLSAQELQTLIELPGPVVTISLATDPLNADPRVNSTAFKKALDEAQAQLADREGTHQTKERLTALEQELTDDVVFWKEQQKGFVVYVSGAFAKWYKLPVSVPTRVMVQDHPSLLPMMSLQNPYHLFYVLELDKSHTKFWINADGRMRELEVPHLPESVDEVTGREQNERNLQFHTRTSSPSGSERAGMFYGSSSWQDDKDRYLEMFLHAVDAALVEFFPKKNQLVFLSGVEELVVLFRKITKYTSLHEANLRKNDGSQASSTFLFEEAQSHIERSKAQWLEAQLRSFQEEPDQKRKLFETPEILSQAFQGRVATLFVAPELEEWGAFDPDTLVTVRGMKEDRAALDLGSEAVYWTLRNSGTVIPAPAEHLPHGSSIAAHLRY